MSDPVAPDPRVIVSTCLMQGVRRAARLVTAHYERALRPVALTASQFSVLIALAAGGETAPGALADGLGLDRTTLTRVVAPLERRGLLAVLPDPRDGRARILRLLPAGEAVLPEAMRLWETAQAQVVARLGPDREAGLRRGLAALASTG